MLAAWLSRLLDKAIPNRQRKKEQFVKEDYSHLLEDVNVNHILFTLESDASPKDTLEAYKKKLLLQKEFSTEKNLRVAKEVSEDPSARENSEN